MNTEAVSPLRLRMIEDMVIRRFGEQTKRDYIRQVREFTAFLGRSPDRAEPEGRYQGGRHWTVTDRQHAAIILSHRVPFSCWRLILELVSDANGRSRKASPSRRGPSAANLRQRGF